MLRPVPLLLALIPALASGCQPGEAPPPRHVPAKGIVTLDGKPLPGATIGFLPPTGSAGASDVGPDGAYEITTLGFKGIPAGDYTVQISYKMGSDGKPQSLGQQFTLVQPKSMIGAKELLPKKYSDFGASELRVSVPPEGSVNLNFDVKGPLGDPPPISKEFLDAAAEGEPKGQAEDEKAPPAESKPGPEPEAKDEPKP